MIQKLLRIIANVINGKSSIDPEKLKVFIFDKEKIPCRKSK